LATLSPLDQLRSLYPKNMTAISGLCSKLDWNFINPDLLLEALTHSSAARDFNRSHKDILEPVPWNERLEFLGDSVLGLALSTALLKHPEKFPEGELSKIRAALVNEESLALIAKDLGLGEALILSKGEEKGGGREKPSVLADAVEAVLGAIFLDGGFAEAEKIILKLYEYQLSKHLKDLIQKDFKSRLQELTQSKYKEIPTYEVVSQKGPDHNTSFEVEVKFRGVILGRGDGATKKRASQIAAQNALLSLQKEPTAYGFLKPSENNL